jgi:hypothetical protein
LSNTFGEKRVTPEVANECRSCVSSTSIDLSVGAFTALASGDVGLVSVQWGFN